MRQSSLARSMAVVLFVNAMCIASPTAVANETEEQSPAVDGAEGDLAALQRRLAEERGHPVVVNFWATWCLPCLQEVPLLNDLQGRFAARGLRSLAVSLDAFVFPDPDQARTKVSRAVTERKFRIPTFLYLGDEAALTEAFELPAGLPVTLLLGPDGEILDRVEGQLEPKELERLSERIRQFPAERD